MASASRGGLDLFNNPILFSDPLGNDPGGDDPLDPTSGGGVSQHCGGGRSGTGGGGGTGISTWGDIFEKGLADLRKALKQLEQARRDRLARAVRTASKAGTLAQASQGSSRGSTRDNYVNSGSATTLPASPVVQAVNLPAHGRTDHLVATAAPQFNLLPVVPNTVPIPSVRPEVLPTTPPPITTNPIAIGNPFLMSVASYEAYRKTPEGQAFVSQAGVNPSIALTEFVYGLTQDGVVTMTGSYASGGGADGKTQKQRS